MKKTPELVAEAERLKAEGMSYAKIGTILGVSRSTVQLWDGSKKPSSDAQYQKEYRKENAEKISKQKSGSYCENREHVLAQVKVYQQNNKAKIAQRKREHRIENIESMRLKDRRYKQDHKDSINERARLRYNTSPQVRLATNLRNRLRHALDGKTKIGSHVDDLGCSISDFKRYIEDLFAGNMSWENRGSFHLDHIIPLSSFDLTDPPQFLNAVHYTNLQPLTPKDNWEKSDSLGWSHA